MNDLDPGSSLDVAAGTKVRISARAYGHASQVPLRRLQIIGHGEVLAEVTAGDERQSGNSFQSTWIYEVRKGAVGSGLQGTLTCWLKTYKCMPWLRFSRFV